MNSVRKLMTRTCARKPVFGAPGSGRFILKAIMNGSKSQIRPLR
jgi:hypothetical protein